MGFLTRRSSAQPVDVRRAPADPLPPVTVVMPGISAAVPPPPPVAAPQTTSHVTQNFFYPPPQPPAPVAATTPAPAHFQTTVHHHYGRRSERKLSFFGTVGLVLGVLSCATIYVPDAQPFTRWLAISALTAGGLGLFSSSVLGLTRAGAPLLAILSAIGGIVLSLRGGNPSASLESLRRAIPTQIPSIHLQLDPAVAQPASSPPTFSVPAMRSSQPPVQQNPPAPRPLPTDTNLETVRTNAARALGIDYPALVAERADAAAALKQARATQELGSPELIEANQRFMRADAALNAARQRLTADPAVSAVARTASNDDRRGNNP